MTRDLLAELDDARMPRPRHIGLREQTGAVAAHDPSGRPPLGRPIPDGCGCGWLLVTTDPATWRRTEANPKCKVHGDSSSGKGAGT